MVKKNNNKIFKQEDQRNINAKPPSQDDREDSGARGNFNKRDKRDKGDKFNKRGNNKNNKFNKNNSRDNRGPGRGKNKFNRDNRNNRNDRNSQGQEAQNNSQSAKDEIQVNNDNFFDFDGDTSIVNKLKNNGKSGRSKSNNTESSWNYNSVISAEEQMRKIKEAQKKEDQKNEKKSEDAMDIDEEVDELLPEEKNATLDPPQNDESTSDNENEDNYNANNINKFESDVYSKDASFVDFNLSKLILKGLANMEFFHPTKVQEKVLPIIARGHDVLINSETGSGKTACFLLPIIQKIITNKNSRTPIKSLILLPTRELAYQCSEMLGKFTKYLEEVTYVSICGGMAIENQINQLKTNPDVIIATPGRLIDMLYNYKSVNSSFLENINILVLDEADKLLELGFKDAIMEIISMIKENKNRQTLLFSATLNTKIIDLGKDALKNPVKIKMTKSAILTNLKQSIVRMKFKKVEDDEFAFEKRMAYLINLLTKDKEKIQAKYRSIIFFNTKKECHKANITLKKFDIISAELHSDIPQPERLKNLDMFQSGKIAYLLCTDIAARGIDVEKVRCVINFQMPLLEERYIHRIGRTARKGYQGEAITICDDRERLLLKKLTKKENFEISNVAIDNNSIKNTYKELTFHKGEIESQFEGDMIDKELMAAEQDVEKTINMKIHQKEIYNKPKKSWFMDKKQKKDLQKKIKQEIMNRMKENVGDDDEGEK
jgi:ATP-dependent RNA helicase DDX27